jgi:hypothetical protein
MDQQQRDYAVGYGKPPTASQFQKGQSGNPGGRPRRKKTLVALLGEALSRRSKADGSRMTQAEAIFAGLVGEAAAPDLKAMRLLFDLLVTLQRSDLAWPVNQIELDDGAGNLPAEDGASAPPAPRNDEDGGSPQSVTERR